MSATLDFLKTYHEQKEKTLETKQNNFRIFVDTQMNSNLLFEENAINDLLAMRNLKTEIAEIERIITVLEAEEKSK